MGDNRSMHILVRFAKLLFGSVLTLPFYLFVSAESEHRFVAVRFGRR